LCRNSNRSSVWLCLLPRWRSEIQMALYFMAPTGFVVTKD
jgi:hypothetical protein